MQGAGLPIQAGGWSWSNPSPQGAELSDVAFDGARGYAVGEEGTVIRSDDAGRTWVALHSGTDSTLTQVQELDPDTVLVGGGCALNESTDAGATFRPLAPAMSRCGVESFSFLSANTGYLELSKGELLFTNDGGRTAEARTRPSAAEHPGDIRFLSSTLGFALANGSAGGEIRRTLDGASTWATVAAVPATLSDLTFVTPAIGYAVGGHGTLLRSTDGGASWRAQPLVVPERARSHAFTHIACSDALHCLITSEAGSYGGSVVVRTSDGGATGSGADPSEETRVTAPQLFGVGAVAFSSPSTAIVVGQDGATFVSEDGGATFTAPAYRFRPGFSWTGRIRLGPSGLDAYVPSGEGIVATTDGGVTWNVLRAPASSEFADVAFPSAQVGYLVNSAGGLTKTTDAGRTWTLVQSLDRTPSAVLAPNAHTVVVIRSGGVTLSTDGGAHFRSLDPPVAIPVRGHRPHIARLSQFNVTNGAETAGGAMFAFGDPLFPLVGHDIYADSVLESTDNGLHWTRLPSPFAHEPPWAISFVSASAGYESCAGRLFFTRNRGQTWSEIGSLGAEPEVIYPPVNLSFSSVRDGYALVDYGAGEELETVLRTQDGGRSWVPQQLAPADIGLSQIKAGGVVDYAIGEDPSHVYTTRHGGRSSNASKLTLTLAGSRRVSASRLARAGGAVHLVGRLRPALAGAQITIAYSSRHGFAWTHKVATVDAGGSFRLAVYGIRKTTRFVAQWKGTESVGGAGTPAVELIVAR